VDVKRKSTAAVSRRSDPDKSAFAGLMLWRSLLGYYNLPGPERHHEKAKAGKEKDVEAAFSPAIAATKKETGCLAYELNRDPDDPTSYVMYEKFKSVAARADHLKQDHTTKLLKALEPLTDGEIKAKVYAVPE
jgi:quinol monooxygenase YgiN